MTRLPHSMAQSTPPVPLHHLRWSPSPCRGGIYWHLPSKRPAPAQLWAKFPTRWRLYSVATQQRRFPFKAFMAARMNLTNAGRKCWTALLRWNAAWVASPSSWSPKWGRTGMIAVPMSLRRLFPIWALTLSAGHYFKRPKKPLFLPCNMTWMPWVPPALLRATKHSYQNS